MTLTPFIIRLKQVNHPWDPFRCVTAMPQPCDIRVTESATTLNGVNLHAAQPVSWFHSLLGEPSRVEPAGRQPAPVGHRNNQIHFYDELGIRLNEHHYTYQIQGLTVVLDTEEATHPTTEPFSGTLQIGSSTLAAGDDEKSLVRTGLPFVCELAGTWFADVQSAPKDGRKISVAVAVQGRRLASGRRSRRREIVSVSLGLEHDPWDTAHRPE